MNQYVPVYSALWHTSHYLKPALQTIENGCCRELNAAILLQIQLKTEVGFQVPLKSDCSPPQGGGSK